MSVEEALAAVIDPELGRSLGELRMIGAVDFKRRRARLTIRLPGPGYPAASAEELRRRVVEAVSSAGGPQEVEPAFEVMDEEEQRKLVSFLAGRFTGDGDGEGEGDGAHGHAGAGGHAHGGGSGKSLAGRLGARTRVLGIASGKGGVGKSSVTVNLAIALHGRGHSVGILDADVYGFSIPGMLGVSVSPMTIDNMVVPPTSHGVRCLSMGFFVSDEQPVIWRGPMLHKALEQFLADAWWGDPDFLLIDMPPGTGDVTLSMAEYLPASEILVVTTPQPAAARVAQRSAYAARKLRLPLRGVVENMSFFTGDDGKRYELFGAGGGQQLADSLGVPLLGQVPLVPALREGGDDGLPVTISDPDSEVSQAFRALAETVEALRPPRRYPAELKVR